MYVHVHKHVGLTELSNEALITPSYDVVRWGKILDICDCPRLGYDITILALWSHWKRWACDAV